MDKKMIAGAAIIAVIAIIGIYFSLFSNVNATGNLAVSQANEKTASPVKEFVMQSYTDVIDGKYYPKFSLKEITVNKGDLVRIKITMTSGMHDFKIDEFNAFAETPLNKEVTVEFLADKTGEFVYYCSKPMHRELGQWGTLKVIDKQ
ncbi:MAG: hypothetical protein Q7R70_05185 [Candidatus Diapherotrites archaeon]|nr:hypothetical protein [Candidatus Diapherotrites archaeon]